MPKTFSDHALEKIADVFANHGNHVGSELKRTDPTKYASYIASDCITFVIWVLQHAFRETGNPIAADKVGTLGAKGTDLAKYLIDQHHWHGVYYNPDVNHPSDGSGEHIFSYYKQVKAKCTYSVARVPISHRLINYRPSGIEVSRGLPLTTPSLVDLNVFRTVPFGFGLSRGGEHTWLYSYGKVYESHWDQEAASLYSSTDLNMFPWLSGVVVVPFDSSPVLGMSKVSCP